MVATAHDESLEIQNQKTILKISSSRTIRFGDIFADAQFLPIPPLHPNVSPINSDYIQLIQI